MVNTRNFFHEESPPSAPRSRPVFAWCSALVILIIFVIGVGAVGVRAYHIGTSIVIAKQKLEEGIAYARDRQFDESQKSLSVARTQFARAEHEMSGIFFREAERIPFLGVHLSALRETIQTAMPATDSLERLLEFGGDLKKTIDTFSEARSLVNPTTDTLASLTIEEKRKLLQSLVTLTPKLEEALVFADAAAAQSVIIPENDLLLPVSRAVRALQKEVMRLRDDLRSFVPLARVAPYFAGYPAPRQTLILFLNNAELRPGGGFLGVIGHVSVADATVNELTVKDVYAIDGPSELFMHVPPPVPLARYLGVHGLFMRDANWSPDFRVSAEAVADFYERETSAGKPTRVIDSVIGFTPTFASEILRITGPITVDGQTFTADNLYDLLEYQVEKGFDARGVPFHQRKEILVKLVDMTIAKLAILPFSSWEEVLGVTYRAFREKHLMMYDRTSVVEDHLHDYGMSGSVDTGDADFLMVVDANLASLKTDPSVKREIAYHIEPDHDTFKATVSITYRHEGHFDWKTTRYRTYTRLYVPEGSEFIEAHGALADDKLKNPRRDPGKVDVGEEFFSSSPSEGLEQRGNELLHSRHRESGFFDAEGWAKPEAGKPGEAPPSLREVEWRGEGATVFGAFTSTEPGEEHTLSFTYRLPSRIAQMIREQNRYTLKVQKQLGAFARDLTLDLDFGKRVMTATPAGESNVSGDIHYRAHTTLSEDRTCIVTF